MPDYKISKVCPICEKVFITYKCKNSKTCSNECRHKMHSVKLQKKICKTCVICDQKFEVSPAKSHQQTCSWQCHLKRTKAKTQTCLICNKDMSNAKTRRTCSRQCMSKYYQILLQGEKNPNWKGGAWSRANSGISGALRDMVLSRDGYKCQDCGAADRLEKPSILHIHHIMFHTNGGKTEAANLLTLCFVCHFVGKHGYTLNKTMREIASRTHCGNKYLNVADRDSRHI